MPTSRPSALILILFSLVSATAPIRAAENPAAAFRREWEGRRVTVQRTLLTLVYDERGRFGTTRGRREGLMVATPSKGSYYLFTGRRSVEDLTHTDADRLFEMVKTHYRSDRNLDDGFVQIVTPLHLVQYIRGIELVVKRVEIDRAIVRLVLFKPESTEEMATTLAVQWPAPLSSDLQERAEVERLIRQFLNPLP